MLTINENKKPIEVFTPTSWQTVILRLFGVVSSEKLAKVLKTETQTIELEAKRLGLEKIKKYPYWLEKGYITILRSIWNLLPYSQILEILEIDEKELEFRLKEDDFLSVKLGDKPNCPEIRYSPLNDKEIVATELLANVIREGFIENYVTPFDFYDQTAKEMNNFGANKIVYDYSAIYGDIFLDGDSISENELGLLAEKGINGLWFQGVLSTLSPYPFKKGLSDGYQKRRDNLNKLIDKCAKYNIKVYLYVNEPRGLNENDFTPELEELKGARHENDIALCTSTKRVKDYLFEAFYDLSKACPSLGGYITITMSENLTNCYSNNTNTCPRCLARAKSDVVSEINNIIQSAVSKAGASTKVIANLWGWTKGFGFTDEEIAKGISLLDEKIEVMCVSELGTQVHNGEEKYVAEYSLSQIGPSLESAKMLSIAKQNGRKTWTKAQVNCSWEYASAPYIPVYELIIEHLTNHIKLGTNAYMLSWTLGGYPSKNLELVNELLGGDFSYDAWLEKNYGKDYKTVKDAVHEFCQAFKKIPYDYTMLYYGAQHVGSANLVYAKPTGYVATMVGMPYDDLASWLSTDSEEEFVLALEEMTKSWKRGLDILEKANIKEDNPLYRYAKAFYLGYSTNLNQAKFIIARRNNDKNQMLKLLDVEEMQTKEQYKLASMDSKLGFEATNHYYYTQNSYLEKLINIYTVRKEIENDN